MASQADERTMVSERVAPGMLPRVLNSFDMTIIFVAIVLFVVNASAIQQAHQAAYTYWILGFLLFLVRRLDGHNFFLIVVDIVGAVPQVVAVVFVGHPSAVFFIIVVVGCAASAATSVS